MRTMLKLSFSLKFVHLYRTLVYIILLLVYCTSRHHLSAADADDGDVRSTEDQSDTSLPCSKRTSKNLPVELTTIKTEENGELRNKSRFVVFGTEGTICCKQSQFEILLGRSYVSNHSECPHWETSDEKRTVYIFLPHLRILFDYLLAKGVRIVFFTSAPWQNNEISNIISKLFESFWGREKYEELKSQGQFQMYSGEERYYIRREDDIMYYYKNLEPLKRGKESLSNAILVDGHPEERHPDQEPFIFVRTFYPGTDRDGTRLNSVYYILGLFKTYFENGKYKRWNMRTAFKKILPVNFGLDESLPEGLLRWDEGHPFVHKMMNVGLSAVREEVPNATLYKRFGPWWGGDV